MLCIRARVAVTKLITVCEKGHENNETIPIKSNLVKLYLLTRVVTEINA